MDKSILDKVVRGTLQRKFEAYLEVQILPYHSLYALADSP